MIDIPQETKQIILVTTLSWESCQGKLYQYDRSANSDDWVLQKPPIPVVVGKNGMAWGLGLHTNLSGPIKREGDGKSPAGVFALGPAFGPQPFQTKMDFLSLHADIEAVDDPSSRYYNRIVDRQKISDIDWTSSEKMGGISLYELGLVIHHNWETPVPGAGSAIFMHLWRDETSGTAGCTAMSRQDLSELLMWLDPQKKPLLIQMPKDTQ
jgi:L,D-peptidoglycan transpeptidase YkuD (ErfK/YbiS/YcfS/YnhG family)